MKSWGPVSLTSLAVGNLEETGVPGNFDGLPGNFEDIGYPDRRLDDGGTLEIGAGALEAAPGDLEIGAGAFEPGGGDFEEGGGAVTAGFSWARAASRGERYFSGDSPMASMTQSTPSSSWRTTLRGCSEVVGLSEVSVVTTPRMALAQKPSPRTIKVSAIFCSLV